MEGYAQRRAHDAATDYNSVINQSAAMDFTRGDMDMEYMDNYDGRSSMSEVDSDRSNIKAKAKKSSKGIGCYAYLKMFNVLLYLSSLLLAFAYFKTTKYNSDLVYYAFYGLICGRPAVIGLYTLIVLCLNF